MRWNSNFWGPDPRIHQQRRDLLAYHNLLDRIQGYTHPDPVPDTAWHIVGDATDFESPPYQGNWVKYNQHPLCFRLDAEGRVWLRGITAALQGVQEQGTIFTLPTWARPQERQLFGSSNSNRPIYVETNGRVTAIGANTATNFDSFHINFDGVHFRAWQQDEGESFNDGLVDFGFFDGFESGDFSGWEAVVGSPVVSGSQVFSGSFSMETFSADWVTHTFTPQADGVALTAEAYIYYSSAYLADVGPGATLISPIYFSNAFGDYQLGATAIEYLGQWYWFHDSDSFTYTTVMVPDEWHKVSITGTFTNGGSGLVEDITMLVDDVTVEGGDTTWTWGGTYNPVSQVEFGGGGTASAEPVYMDDCSSEL